MSGSGWEERFPASNRTLQPGLLSPWLCSHGMWGRSGLRTPVRDPPRGCFSVTLLMVIISSRGL